MISTRKQPGKDRTLDRLFRAFADTTRLRILHMLEGGEKCVCDIVDSIGAPQPTVSRHLAYLRRSGLVKVRSDGLWKHYTLTPPRDSVHAKLMECVACCFGPMLNGESVCAPTGGKSKSRCC